MKKILINESQDKIIKDKYEIKLSPIISKSLELNKHSLSNHPCFPPSEENNFDEFLINNRFKDVCERIKKFKDIDGYSPEYLKQKMRETINQIKQIEQDNIDELINICQKSINELFKIPHDVIEFKIEIVNVVNDPDIKINLKPIETSDFEYDSVDDMEDLEYYIYKRRFVNSLIQGSSVKLSELYNLYLNDIYEVDPKLPELYSKAMAINNLLYFIDKQKITDDISKRNGCVKVLMSQESPTIIKVQGVNFIAILNETIKGLMELFATYGLPDEKNKAMFVMSKADFAHAEPWDVRFGYPLWDIIFGQIPNDKTYLIPNIFMELISLDKEEFCKTVKELLAKTRKGQTYFSEIFDKIDNEYKIANLNDSFDDMSSKYISIDDIDNIVI